MVISLKSWTPSGKVHGHWGWMHTALLTSLLRWSAAQLSVSPDVVTAAVGETVTLSVGYTGRLRYFMWYRGGKANANESILNVFGSGPPTPGPGYTGRETALPDGSLRIRDVQMNYTGSYTVLMNTDLGGLREATVQLRVYGVPPDSDASCTSWWVTLAVASGMLLGAAFVVLGVVLFYERRVKKAKGVTPGGRTRVINESTVNYENMRNGNRAQTAAQSPDAGHTYMALQLGDQTTYDHLQRPQD
ncbi:hypothetical protein NDU88_011517 [Pleurodeles waltl]|uniref:Immunoglobulin domain-containing protein n=2 Tax=Pleurodeles waltl TaxID=8319 RepID=A0AAV7Q596_PLEWA|nr:hypothetical protein NDU88_011517 [Pleurodeles waltl]